MSYQNISEAGTRFTKGHGPKQVFVFGAGLSMPAGLPAASLLLQQAFIWKMTTANRINTTLIEAFCDYFYPRLQREHGEYPDAEDMLGMMDAAEEYDGVRGRGRGYKWRSGFISDTRKQLTRFLGEFLWSFQNDKTSKAIGYIRNIVRKNTSRTIFITFNYDLLLETALTQEKIEFSYAVDKNNYSRNVVLKPHGSINWSYPSDHPRLKSWQADSCIKFLNRIYIFDQLDQTFIKSHINPAYVFIAPTPHKQIENKFLKRQWTSFSSSIHKCPNITIVGYSLPTADRLARIVLRRGGPLHNVDRQITVIDPGNLADRYRKNILPRINYIQEYCQNYYA